MNNSFTWEFMGPLNSPYLLTDKIGGVYLLVFKGTPKRVIYVGTTTDFNARIEQHRIGMLTGKRSVWRVESGEDIYAVMSYNGEKKPFYNYYLSLAKNGLLWATTTINKEASSNDLVKKDSFDNWRDFVHSSYIRNLEVWICRTPHDNTFGQHIEERQHIESQIQITLKNNYSIGSHINSGRGDMCWLGKIEKANEVFKKTYTFTNAPDISDEFTQLLNNPTDKNVLEYMKPAKAQKKAEAAERLKAERETYKNAGKSWKILDEIEFKKLVNSHTPLNEIAKRFSRSPEEIVKRYEYLIKNHVKLPELRYG